MDILSQINWVDVLAVIICFRISYVAFQDGMSHEIFPLLGAIGTLVLALHYCPKMTFAVANGPVKLPEDIGRFFSFLVLVTVFGLIFKFLRSLLDKIIKVTWHPVLDKLGGILLGIARSVIVVSIVLTLIALAPVPYLQHSIRDRSLVGMHFLKIGPVVYKAASKYLPIDNAGVAGEKK